MLCPVFGCLAQHNVVGIIVNENGRPVGGVNVLIKGTPRGTVTDSLGQFELMLPPGRHELLIAFLKYKTLETGISIKPAYHYKINAILIRDTLRNRRLKSSCEIQGQG